MMHKYIRWWVPLSVKSINLCLACMWFERFSENDTIAKKVHTTNKHCTVDKRQTCTCDTAEQLISRRKLIQSVDGEYETSVQRQGTESIKWSKQETWLHNQLSQQQKQHVISWLYGFSDWIMSRIAGFCCHYFCILFFAIIIYKNWRPIVSA